MRRELKHVKKDVWSVGSPLVPIVVDLVDGSPSKGGETGREAVGTRVRPREETEELERVVRSWRRRDRGRGQAVF